MQCTLLTHSDAALRQWLDATLIPRCEVPLACFADAVIGMLSTARAPDASMSERALALPHSATAAATGSAALMPCMKWLEPWVGCSEGSNDALPASPILALCPTNQLAR